MTEFQKEVKHLLMLDGGATLETASTVQLYNAVSKAAMETVYPRWTGKPGQKRACYFSAEFLVGRLVYNNLMNLGLLGEMQELFRSHGLDPALLEEVEDDALGNGGLGRLAACFLDSAATHSIPLDGYGIRYRYGLFRQSFENGFQKESPDDWLRFGDPWSVRREKEQVLVQFKGQTVRAVPYDMAVIGYGGTVNTLRLWQAEPVHAFDFDQFNAQKYGRAFQERNEAEAISSVLYPNDDTNQGKRLRLKQQYFFSSASLQDLIRRFRQEGNRDFAAFPSFCAIQLNDTHPVVSIPELIRLLGEEGIGFDDALPIVRETFAYTNHTVMAEALEKWDIKLFRSVLPHLVPIVRRMEQALETELRQKSVPDFSPYRIVDGNTIHMARMAVFSSHSTNGVAKIHTELLKKDVLKEWYALYPERFHNETNGVTQRRWLKLCNQELAGWITQRIGDEWVTDLSKLKELEPFAGDPAALQSFAAVKREKKSQLAAHLLRREGIAVSPDWVFDVQIKRLHEYKRQLLNGFSIWDLAQRVKQGDAPGYRPTVFLFGAKAAPGYFRAKAIIKYLHEIAKSINNDPALNNWMKVIFVTDYNVSYAEKLVPAADISEQISTAGTEASGTGNMKLALNGAVTLGTYDGANIEIVSHAGEENNYIFGARVEELDQIRENYDPNTLYRKEPRIRRAVDSLVDGTFDDGGTGMFQELYGALLQGASWHKPDHYFLLLDFLPYCDAKLRAISDTADAMVFARKGLLNTARSGWFSSDRTVADYAKEIWRL